MVTILVSYWREGKSGSLTPGDITIAYDRFPATDLEIEQIKDDIRADLRKRSHDEYRVTIVNIVRLGESSAPLATVINRWEDGAWRFRQN